MNRATARTFQDLIVWQKAHQFVLALYQSSVTFPSWRLKKTAAGPAVQPYLGMRIRKSLVGRDRRARRDLPRTAFLRTRLSTTLRLTIFLFRTPAYAAAILSSVSHSTPLVALSLSKG